MSWNETIYELNKIIEEQEEMLNMALMEILDVFDQKRPGN